MDLEVQRPDLHPSWGHGPSTPKAMSTILSSAVSAMLAGLHWLDISRTVHLAACLHTRMFTLRAVFAVAHMPF